MEPILTLKKHDLKAAAEAAVKALSSIHVQEHSVYINTAVIYSNGDTVSVRLDFTKNGFSVSDNGQAAFFAQTVGAGDSLKKVAGELARRYSVGFAEDSFFINNIEQQQLPAAVAIIANVSASALEKILSQLHEKRLKGQKEVFKARIKEVFAEQAVFDFEANGAAKNWEVDAALLTRQKELRSFFEYVRPSFNSIAAAHMKIADIRAVNSASAVVVLSDYEATEAPLRSILSSSADAVIDEKAGDEIYRRAA